MDNRKEKPPDEVSVPVDKVKPPDQVGMFCSNINKRKLPDQEGISVNKVTKIKPTLQVMEHTINNEKTPLWDQKELSSDIKETILRDQAKEFYSDGEGSKLWDENIFFSYKDEETKHCGQGRESSDDVEETQHCDQGRESFDEVEETQHCGQGRESFDEVEETNHCDQGRESSDEVEETQHCGQGRESSDEVEETNHCDQGRESSDEVEETKHCDQGRESSSHDIKATPRDQEIDSSGGGEKMKPWDQEMEFSYNVKTTTPWVQETESSSEDENTTAWKFFTKDEKATQYQGGKPYIKDKETLSKCFEDKEAAPLKSSSEDEDIKLPDQMKMPMIGMNIIRSHGHFDRQLIDTFKFGHRHIEIPIKGNLSEKVVTCLFNFCLKRHLYLDRFFLSTSIPVPKDPQETLDDIRHLYTRLGNHPVDVLFLENPVGLQGSDPKAIFHKNFDGTYPEFISDNDIYQRNEDSTLLVTPTIKQNLWGVWRFLETEVVEAKMVRHLGLRNFTQLQILKLLREVKVWPRVIQTEINLYNMREDLRMMCKRLNITVCAIHPFGNPHYVSKKAKPILKENKLVMRLADLQDVDAKMIIMRHLYQSKIPVVFDNWKLPGAGWMF
ncbi:hypothetical protein Hamer_G011977, partial [Homarus americanus]